jgi:serine/threonine protein phosphatase PrpC
VTEPSPRGIGAGATAIGARAHNEDAFSAQAPVFIVSDGMGGHVGGAAAAAAVVEAFDELAKQPTLTPAHVRAAVAAAQSAVLEVAEGVGDHSGATLAGVIAVEHKGEPWWLVINVGDSRVYAMSEGVLTQVTVDHSRVQDLIEDGSITVEESLVHPERNVITRAIGDGSPEFDAWLVPARDGDRFIVTSDGLTRTLTDAQIETIVLEDRPLQAVADRLVEVACQADAQDNVTVVVVDSQGAQTPEDADPSPWRTWPSTDDTEGDTTLGNRVEAFA